MEYNNSNDIEPESSEPDSSDDSDDFFIEEDDETRVKIGLKDYWDLISLSTRKIGILVFVVFAGSCVAC